jgi:hypothetical protein
VPAISGRRPLPDSTDTPREDSVVVELSVSYDGGP